MKKSKSQSKMINFLHFTLLAPYAKRSFVILGSFSILIFAFYIFLRPMSAEAGALITRPQAVLGMVGYWTFDGADVNWTTNIASDRSGQGNNGNITSMSTTTAPVAGKLGQALKFDGVNDYVEINQTSNVVGGLSSFSVAAWVKSNVSHPPGSNDQIVSIQNSGGQENKNFELFKANANDSFGFMVYNASTFATVLGDNADPGGSWRHVVGVWNAGTLSIYVDGQKQSGSATLAGPTNNNAVPIHIGTYGAVTETEELWPGLIDDVRVYNRALSANEVKQLYLLGR